MDAFTNILPKVYAGFKNIKGYFSIHKAQIYN